MTTFRSLCGNILAQMANEQEREKCKPYVWQMEFLLNLLAEDRRDAVFLKARVGLEKLQSSRSVYCSLLKVLAHFMAQYHQTATLICVPTLALGNGHIGLWRVGDK